MLNYKADAGLSTIIYFALLLLHFRQTAHSRSATGLSRVSRYPILIQSLIDAISFIGVRSSLNFTR